MSEAIPIEKRVEELEHQVTELRQQLAQKQSPDDRFRRLSGSFADQPEFEEVLRLDGFDCLKRVMQFYS